MSMYYDEVHLTASGKGMWSNLCVLVDAGLCYMKKNNVVRLSLKKKQKARRESFVSSREKQDRLW
ncbi:hypothetical protein ARALYDRAFT_899133 [Arabidopsis lyrata subsp. lyrata]|uniref:Uncharacterized protein n=1 Tax=Arabidopsis lyrata subsp. lyrata TaxID=81972 RepID=D7L6C1_ARALL|nr:hypothetical protein ARALYDRAFT_899133 [Arabidopsis lyrata subsp. lyrata]